MPDRDCDAEAEADRVPDAEGVPEPVPVPAPERDPVLDAVGCWLREPEPVRDGVAVPVGVCDSLRVCVSEIVLERVPEGVGVAVAACVVDGVPVTLPVDEGVPRLDAVPDVLRVGVSLRVALGVRVSEAVPDGEGVLEPLSVDVALRVAVPVSLGERLDVDERVGVSLAVALAVGVSVALGVVLGVAACETVADTLRVPVPLREHEGVTVLDCDALAGWQAGHAPASTPVVASHASAVGASPVHPGAHAALYVPPLAPHDVSVTTMGTGAASAAAEASQRAENETPATHSSEAPVPTRASHARPPASGPTAALTLTLALPAAPCPGLPARVTAHATVLAPS